jgi:ABC-type Fe3+/spermidine/putrescine transport system ATPase subunit/ABC-type sulfate transport system permease component
MNRERLPAALWILAALLAIYLIAPFAAGLGEAGVADWRSVDVAALTSASIISLASATVATALVTVGGVPLGYLLVRRPGRAMALLSFIVQLPLALPPLSSGVLLLFLVGYSSPLGRLTQGALIDSFAGIVLAEAFVSAPFLIIAARSAFAGVDPNLEDVAATLGHRSWSVFVRISLPLAWRTILAGMLLAWLRAFGEFGATVMVAYHPYSLPVFTYVAFGSEGLPAMMPVLAPTLLAAVAVMAASQLLGRPARQAPPRRAGATWEGAFAIERPSSAGALALRAEAALELAFRRELDAFKLDVAWRTNAARLGILGPSGSGKSMTLRLIAGLDRSMLHRVVIAGRDVSDLAPYARGIAYVPQNYGLFPHMSVGEQISFPPDCDGDAARRWIGRLGLDELRGRHPSELSLGEQQRVALARALCRRADLLLLDEPLSALDAPLRARLRQELVELQQAFTMTTILVTHDPAEALLLADELLLLDTGRVLQSGPVETVFRRPATETVARLLGADNINHGLAVDARTIDVGGSVTLEVSGPPLPIGQRVGWSVRAQRVRLARDGRYCARLVRTGEVRAGSRALTLQLGGATLQVAADPGCCATESCRVDIDPQSVQVWVAAQQG